MSEFKCIVCGGNHFREGYYEVEVNTEIYSSAHNNASISSNDYELRNKLSVDVNTNIIHDEIITREELYFNLYKQKEDFTDSTTDYRKYACEDCGFIMSFTKEKKVESREQEKERKKKERMYDWTNFEK